MTKHDTFGAVAEKVSSIVGDGGLNLLINNAAVLLKTPVGECPFSKMSEEYETNTISPLMLTEALLPLLKRASVVVPNMTYCLSNPAVVNVSSIGGSLETRTVERLAHFDQVGFKSRDMYAYSCSKVKTSCPIVKQLRFSH